MHINKRGAKYRKGAVYEVEINHKMSAFTFACFTVYVHSIQCIECKYIHGNHRQKVKTVKKIKIM